MFHRYSFSGMQDVKKNDFENKYWIIHEGEKMEKRKLGVKIRGGFSDRNKIQEENIEMQFKEFDKRTRTNLVNATSLVFNKYLDSSSYRERDNILKAILSEAFCLEVDYDAPCSSRKVMEMIYEVIRNNSYDDILSIIEFFAKEVKANFYLNDVFVIYNMFLEKEYVGYRFVNDQITPITDELEISTINEAIEKEDKTVSKHIDKAIQYLSDRENPDYENSIKESISAVEAMCVKILGKKATLGAALKKLENVGVDIHPGLKSAFEKLYGYTSDAAGIRHAGDIGSSNSTFQEAKFMLVSCCAFVNYLKTSIAN